MKRDTEEEVKRKMGKRKNVVENINNKLILKDKINKNKNNNSNSPIVVAYYATHNAITLLALIITIILLLILAGVTISIVIGPNGLLNKAQETAKQHKIQEIQEKLELEKANASLDNKGQLTLEKYLQHLIDKGIINKEEIQETEKEEAKQITVEKYIFLVEKEENGNIKITYQGEAGKLKPILEIEITQITTNQITVKAQGKRMEKGEYKYYIKEIETGKEYELKETKKENEYTYTGLTHNKEYRIKVEAKNENGTATKESGIIRTVTLEDIKEAEIDYIYNPTGWTNESITITANVTKEIPEGYRIETSKDATNWEAKTSQNYTSNGEMYVRITDGTNETTYAVGQVTKIDKQKPIITKAEAGITNVAITATDEASGIIGYAVVATNAEPSTYTTCTNTKSLSTTVTGLTANTTYYVFVKDEAGNVSVSKQFSTIKLNAGDVIKTEGNIKYVSDGEENVIPVPNGFSYAGIGTKETGFVIKNDEDLNEFVWIPTDLVTYQTYDWYLIGSPTAYTEYYIWNEEENTKIINEITNSVNIYKGYYISRYEAGVTTKRTATTTDQADLPAPIFRATSSAAPVYAYNYVSWDDAIYIGNRLYSKEKGNNVTSRLINARGWDTALKFIETIGEDKDETYPINSSGKGWYEDNSSDNSNYEIGKSVDLTNTSVPNKLKNIYDMAGNMREWTADKSTGLALTNRASRRWLLFWDGAGCYS